MNQTEPNSHQLLIHKLLVSVHYLTLFRDEIVLVEKTPSLLGASFSPLVVQSELGEILSAVDTLSKQEKLIKSTFWYDEASFRLMNLSLDIVGTWLRGVDHILELCESKSVFQAILGDKRSYVFGILIDVFTSLRVTNLAIKEDSAYPILLSPLGAAQYRENEELVYKMDLLFPEGEDFEDDSEEMAELLSVSRSEVIKTLRRYLFDNNSLVYVLDARSDLLQEMTLYSNFDRFTGAYEQMSAILVTLEEILDDLDERPSEEFNEEGQLVSESTLPIYLLIYGYNKLQEDSRFISLMSELEQFSNRTDFTILAYQAY